MTAAKDLREAEDSSWACAPQPEPAPAEPHEQRTLLARIGQLETALAAGERREHALQVSKTQLAQTLARQQSLNAAFLKSTSWRITAPLRAAVDVVRTFGDMLSGVVRHHRQKIIHSGSRCVSQRRIPGSGRFVYIRAMCAHRKALPAPRAPEPSQGS